MTKKIKQKVKDDLMYNEIENFVITDELDVSLLNDGIEINGQYFNTNGMLKDEILEIINRYIQHRNQIVNALSD